MLSGQSRVHLSVSEPGYPIGYPIAGRQGLELGGLL